MTYYLQMISIQSDFSVKLFNDFIHEFPPRLAFIGENTFIKTAPLPIFWVVDSGKAEYGRASLVRYP